MAISSKAILNILLWITFAIGAPIDLESEVDPYSSFAQIKNITLIVAKNKETYRQPLDQFFRGQNLKYQWELRYINGTFVENNLAKEFVRISNPINLLSQSFNNSQQTTDQYTLPSTSLLLNDRFQNLYLVQLDSQLILHVVNITNYHLQNLPLEEILIDVSNTSAELLHPDKQCNNMVFLNQTVLMVNCKSNVRGGTLTGQYISSALLIDIEKIEEKIVRYFYMFSGFNYNELMDGKMVLFGNYPGDIFRFIVKENATQCSFRIYEIQNEMMAPRILLNVKQFHDPQFDLHKSPNSLKEYKALIPRLKVGRGGFNLEQDQSLKCGEREPFDYYKTDINYLSIRDVQMLDYFPDIVVATDFQYGLLLWKIVNCGQNEYECTAIPIYRVRIQRAGALSILKQTNNDDEKVIFVSQVSPPTIYEVNINSLIRSPYVNRIYSVVNARYPSENYQSLDIIDANNNYIIQHLVEIKSFKPLIRVYKRKASLHSSSYWHIQLEDFVDIGLFIKFIQPNQNYFIVRGSTYHKIYNIQPTYLEINLWNVTPQAIMNDINQKVAELSLNIIIYNETFSKMNVSFALNILDENYLRVVPLQKSENIKPVNLVCGENVVLSTTNMEQFISGQLSLLEIEQNLTENYFRLSKTRINFGQLKLFTAQSCEYSSLIRFQKQILSQKTQWFISCLPLLEKKMTFHSLFTNDTDPDIAVPLYQLPIEQQTSITEYEFDSQNNEYLIVSNNAQGNIILSIFKIFNILQWSSTINLNKKFGDQLAAFKIRSFDPMTYSKGSREGIFIGERQNSSQQILIYAIGAPDTPQDGVVSIKSLFTIDLIEKVEILDVKFDQGRLLWVMLNNGTLLAYKQITIQESDQKYIKLQKRIDMQTIIGEEQTKTILHFDLFSGIQTLVLFSGKNTITLFNYDTNSFILQKSKQLTIQYTDDDSDDETQYDINFIINNQTKKPIYSKLSDDKILLMVFEIKVAGVIVDYQFQMYDISEPLHNSLIIRKNVTVEDPRILDKLQLDPNFARLQAFKVRENPGEYFGLILTIDAQRSATFEFRTETIIYLNSNQYAAFSKNACQKQMKYEFSLYSTDNPREKIKFQVLTQNKGQIITKGKPIDQLGVEVLAKNEILWSNVSPVNRRLLMNSQYSLLNNLNGYNMRFNVSCIQNSELQEQKACPEAKVNLQYASHEENLDFLSTKNQALGFFVIDNFILFFDTIGNTVIYSMTYKQYESVNSTEIFKFLRNQTTRDNGKYPQITIYKMFELGDTRYLVTFNDFNQISISTVIVVKTFKEMLNLRIKYPGLLNNFHQFHQFGKLGEILLVQHAEEYANVFSEIQFLELFKSDQNNSAGIVNAVMAFHDDMLNDQSSRVEVYTFYTGKNDSYKPSKVKLIRNITFQSLYSQRLGFDFQVTCLKVLQKTNVAIIGISKIGLMFYDLDHMKILKIERLATKFSLQSFNPTILDILEVIPDNDAQNFQLLTYRRGILMLSYPEYNEKKGENPYTPDPTLFEELPQRELQNKQTIHNTLYVVTPLGIIYSDVFLNQNLDGDRGEKALIRLNFYGSSVYNQSRNMGFHTLSNYSTACHSLQSINPLSEGLIPNHLLQSFSQVNGTVYLSVICDATLHFIAYNFHPTLNLSLSQSIISLQEEIMTNTLEIVGQNSKSLESFQLQLTVLNSERALNPLLAIAFALSIGIVILISHSLIRKQDKQMEEKRLSIKVPQKPLVQQASEIKRISTLEQQTADFRANILSSSKINFVTEVQYRGTEESENTFIN